MYGIFNRKDADASTRQGHSAGQKGAIYFLKISVLGLVCLCISAAGNRALAQQQQPADTANKITIRILNSSVVMYNKTDSGEYDKFIDSVAFLEGSDTLYCDSAYQNSTTKNFEAFGDVKISQQDGTHGTSNYLKYTSNQKLAFMQGNVVLTDGTNYLRCEELTYNLGTKTSEFFKGGTLQSDSTIVTSNTGVYNVHSKDARFKGNVVVNDPKYHIVSEDLGYNTGTKVETFYAHSTVTSDSGKSILVTDNGTYDSKHVIAHFVGHSSIWDDGQYMEADDMHYNKVTGYGYAIGHVISIDTAHHSTLYCGHAIYFRKQRILWALEKPVMAQVNGKDTLYMRADTFYSAPMVKMKNSTPIAIGANSNNDSLTVLDSTKVKVANDTAGANLAYRQAGSKRQTPNSKKQKAKPNADFIWVLPKYKYRMPGDINDTSNAKPEIEYTGAKPEEAGKAGKPKRAKVRAPKLSRADTASADTTAPMYFVGYNHVLIFSDSMQGKCDSVCYTRSDSTIRMIVAPIVWAHRSQITGDTILLYLDSNQLRKMYVPNNAFVVSQSGPDKAQLWDQVQGKTLTAWFKGNAITRMLVFPNAECIYYSKDDSSRYIGVDEGNSTRMRIFFENQQITNIKFEQDVHQTITPLEKADLPNMKLSRFKWLFGLRPKTKEELFR